MLTSLRHGLSVIGEVLTGLKRAGFLGQSFLSSAASFT